jgi:hypothetical protein
MGRHGFLLAALILVVCGAPPASAAQAGEDLFREATAALERGAPNEAIERLELLADRGVVHPDASFNRGLAYIARAESPRQKPGDLGRAAAALAETIALRPEDGEAARLLEQVREEIARRRTRQGSEAIAMHAGIGWALVGLASENVWAAGALVGSLLVTVGLALALWVRRSATRVASALLIGTGTFFLMTFGALTFAARHRRVTYQAAVVVAPDVRLGALAGRGPSAEARGQGVVPEGAEVRLLEQRGQRASIEWDGSSGWVPLESIRTLPRR